MSFTPCVIEIPLRTQGALRLAVVPMSRCTVESAQGTLEQPKNKLVIQGSCENIPDKTPCHVVLSRALDPTLDPKPLVRELGLEENDDRPCVMKVSGGRFEVEIEVDVFAMGLFGKGALVMAVKPDQPGCEVGGTLRLPFDHQITFEHTPAAPSLMGTLCSFTPKTTGVFQNAAIRLTIEEYDEPDSAEAQGDAPAKDLKLDLDWGSTERGHRTFRLGCVEQDAAAGGAPATVTLAYPEPYELPPYEFAYIVKQVVSGVERPIYKAKLFAPAVPKPKVTTFEVALVDKEDGARDLRVKLGIDGFSDDVGFSVQIALWRAVAAGGGELHMEGVCPVADAVLVPHEGVHEFCCPTLLNNLTNCFAVLSFPGMAVAGAYGVQVSAGTIVDCGDEYLCFQPPQGRDPAWLWEAHWAPPPATGVASKEAGADSLKALRAYRGVTGAQLKQIMPTAKQLDIDTFLVPLNRAMQEFHINTLARQRAFIAQVAHESGSFRYKEEIADGSAYEGRLDLGNDQPGDGRRYKGRGLIQLTGRVNYRSTGAALGLDLEDHPELIVKDPVVSARVSAYFFDSHGLNDLADAGNFREITHRINGGYRGEAERNQFHEAAKKAIL